MEKRVTKEQLSALLDGELDIETTDHVLRELGDGELHATMGLYLQIRDVLRQGDAYLEPSCDLSASIRERLKHEAYLSVDLDDASDTENRKSFVLDM